MVNAIPGLRKSVRLHPGFHVHLHPGIAFGIIPESCSPWSRNCVHLRAEYAVTAHPTAEWTAQQVREAFPWDTVPRYLLRDRDRIFGHEFAKQVKAMGIMQVLSAPRSPWQRAYVERVIIYPSSKLDLPVDERLTFIRIVCASQEDFTS